MRLVGVLATLFLCGWLPLLALAETTLYVSSTLGKPSTNCTVCEPCDTIGRAFEVGAALASNDLYINLYPGNYALSEQGLSRSTVSLDTLGMFGLTDLPACLTSPSHPSSGNIVLEGTWNTSSYSQLSKLSMSHLTWKPAHLQHLDEPLLTLDTFSTFSLSYSNINCSLGCKMAARFDESVSSGLSFQHVLVDSQKFRLDVRPSSSRSLKAGPFELSLFVHKTTMRSLELGGEGFSAHFSQSSFGHDFEVAPCGPMTAQIEDSSFVGTRVSLASWAHGTWTANVTNCTFLPDQQAKRAPEILFNNRVNGLLRYNFFFSEPSLYVHQLFQVENTSWVDARANYWGDPSGPFSCCNPTSKGAFVIGGDTSSWCLDELCSRLSEPLNASVHYDSSHNYTIRDCELIVVCEAAALPLTIVVGCALAVLAVVSLAGRVAVCILDRRSKSTRAYEEVSADASLERVISPLKGDGHGNRFIIVSDIVIVLTIFCIIVASLGPTFLFRTVYAEFIPNNIALLVALGLRIATSAWHLIIMLASGHPNYRSLLANVIMSAGVILLAVTWRFTGFFNLMSLQQQYPMDGPSLTMQRGYFFTIWAAHVLTELFICLPRLIRDFKLLKARDYAGVDALRETVKHAAVGSELPGLLASSRLGPTARGISWLSLVLGILMGIFFTVNQFLSDAHAWRYQSILFLVSSLVSLLGFFFLRFRFYLLAPGYAYFAAAAGITFLMLDSGVQAAYVAISSRDLINAIRSGCILIFVIVSIVRGVILVKILRALRNTLARDLETSVYRQLEATLEN